MLKRLKDEVCDEISEEVIINDIKPTEYLEKLVLNNAVGKMEDNRKQEVEEIIEIMN